MELKFLFTLAASLCFAALYWMSQRKERAFAEAESLPAEVVECCYLDPQQLTPYNAKESQKTMPNKLDIDRSETLGNYIQLRYVYNNKEHFCEYPFIDKAYTIGEKVTIEYIDEQTLRLQDKKRTPYHSHF